MTTPSSNRLGISTRSLVKAGAIAGLVAGVANVVVFFVAVAAGASLEVAMGGTTTTIIFVLPLVASFVAIFLGALVLQAMLRLRSGATLWTVLVLVFFVVYTVYAFTAATTVATGLVLTLMHVIALGVAFAVLLPVARSRAVTSTSA